MKKFFTTLLICATLMLTTSNTFAYAPDKGNTYTLPEPSFLANKVLSKEDISQIKLELDVLNKHHIDTSIINDVNTTANGNEYNLHYNNVDEKVIIKDINNETVTLIASNGNKRNVISYTKDGDIIIDGNKIQISSQGQPDSNINPMPTGNVWKGVKSLSPYGSLKSSDYKNYLTSGKENTALGKALDQMTITALGAIIGGFHPYLGIAVSLSGIAQSVYNVLISVNPKTKYLGCAYTTYIAGPSDYKYINKFYANKACTGKYRTEVSYEHFIVY